MATKDGRSWHCRVCRVSFHAPEDLARHVLVGGRWHIRKLSRAAPEQLQDFDRLQPFLDTHMKEEPILGLEYVVEEPLDSGSYKYTCRLCDVEGDSFQAFVHLLEVDHMARYIDRHHGKISMTADQYRSKAGYRKAVARRARKIIRRYGRKRVKTKESSVEDATPVCPDDSDQKVPNDSSLKVDRLRPGLNNCRTCTLCNVLCASPVSLYQHIMGLSHQKILSQTAPQQLKELCRLQYFLDTYLHEDPLLGLEYIVEEQLEATRYKYTCQLCHVEGDIPLMVLHIRGVSHAERYIDKHHKDLALRKRPDHQKDDYIRDLTKIAFLVLEKYGRQKIQSMITVIDHTASAGVSYLLYKEDCWSVVKVMKERRCCHCGIPCNTTLQMCYHVIGTMHMKEERFTSPQEVNRIGQIQYFLDTYAKEDPLLGLEYIVEEQLDSASYRYRCRLCHVEGDLIYIIKHITNVDHVVSYIKRHHRQLLPSVNKFVRWGDYVTALTEVVVEICTNYDREKCHLKRAADTNGLTVAINWTLDDDSEEAGPLPSRGKVEIGEQSLNSPIHETEPDEMTPTEEIEFTRNVDFLDYLQNVEVKVDEDAIFIQQINQNCSNALLRFWTEEITG